MKDEYNIPLTSDADSERTKEEAIPIEWIKHYARINPLLKIYIDIMLMDCERAKEEAIPINWIKRYVSKNPSLEIFIDIMLIDWKRANSKTNC